MISKTGNAAFDAAALAAEQAHQAALSVPGLTQAAATLADKIFFTAIIAAGIANNVTTQNEHTALNSLNHIASP